MTPSARHPDFITVMTSRDPEELFALLRDVPTAPGNLEALRADLRSGVAYMVAYADAEPVGVLGYRWQANALRVVQVGVSERHQRHGVARRLLQAVEAVGQALGSREITLELPESVHPVFERCGYHPLAQAESALWGKALLVG